MLQFVDEVGAINRAISSIVISTWWAHRNTPVVTHFHGEFPHDFADNVNEELRRPDATRSLLTSLALYAFSGSETMVLGYLKQSIPWLCGRREGCSQQQLDNRILNTTDIERQWPESYWGIVLSNGTLETSLHCNVTALLPHINTKFIKIEKGVRVFSPQLFNKYCEAIFIIGTHNLN